MTLKKCLNLLDQDAGDSSLFSKLDRYLTSCGKNGVPLIYSELSVTERKKLRFCNADLLIGKKLSFEHGFPMVKPYNGPIMTNAVPFSKRKRHKGKNTPIHFFENDYCFEHAVWVNIHKTTMELSAYPLLFAPDFSLFVDLPFTFNLFNIYRSRLVAAHWQSCGYQVIPVASWGDANSLKYCFEGLPMNSVIAVCGVGCNHSQSALMLWNYGLREMEKRLQPTAIIVYGHPKQVDDIATPIFYIQDNISKNFRNG